MNTINTMNTTSENDISPLIPDIHCQENQIIKNKSLSFGNLLECCACSLIIFFTCFKP